jgi:transcriptional regulator with XRE-family HTH domain
MRSGRPKGRSSDNRSFGPLGDLIRQSRLNLGLGLADLADACNCSVQFISNIEHGRAPLPWYMIPDLALELKLTSEEVQVANLAIRADFKSFFNSAGQSKSKKVARPAILKNLAGAASAVAMATKDDQLCELIYRYQYASAHSKKKFLRAAFELLETAPDSKN